MARRRSSRRRKRVGLFGRLSRLTRNKGLTATVISAMCCTPYVREGSSRSADIQTTLQNKLSAMVDTGLVDAGLSDRLLNSLQNIWITFSGTNFVLLFAAIVGSLIAFGPVVKSWLRSSAGTVIIGFLIVAAVAGVGCYCMNPQQFHEAAGEIYAQVNHLLESRGLSSSGTAG